MKLQSLAVIFIIIILPISILLSSYTQNKIETLSIQSSYDTKLNNATYDALKTFQLNTINNSTSDIPDSKIRDIEASVNSFFNSIASNFNMDGYNRDILKEYVPALVYTMYDGYYIYSSYRNTLEDEDYIDEKEAKESPGIEPSTYQNGDKISGLKSYVYYSCRYQRGHDDFVITYSLDNYITIKGIINGQAVNDAGYLINNCSGDIGSNTAQYRDVTIGTEVLQENILNDMERKYVKINGTKFYKDESSNRYFTIMNGQELDESGSFKVEDNNSAIRYYAEAAAFKKRVKAYGLDELSTEHAVDEKGNSLWDKEEWRKI